MKSCWTGFHSPLAPGIDAFLVYKRALGCCFRVEELSLRLFDRFLIAQTITTLSAITPEVVDAFLVDRKSTRLNSSHIQKSRMPSSA